MTLLLGVGAKDAGGSLTGKPSEVVPDVSLAFDAIFEAGQNRTRKAAFVATVGYQFAIILLSVFDVPAVDL